MRVLDRFTIGTQLTIGFLSVALLCAAVGAGGINAVLGLRESLREMYAERLVPLEALVSLSDRYAVGVVDAAQKVNGGTLDWADGAAAVSAARDDARAAWGRYMSRDLGPEEQAVAADVQAALDNADQVAARLQDVLASRREEALAHLVATDLYPSIEAFASQVRRLTDIQLENAAREYELAEAGTRRTIWLAALLIAWATAGSFLFGHLLTRRIRIGLGRLIAAAERMDSVTLSGLRDAAEALGRGDLDARTPEGMTPLEVQGRDELARLTVSVNGMIAAANDTVSAFDRARGAVARMSMETATLTERMTEGDLASRANAGELSGGYREVVEGINATLDAINAPISEASSVLERVAARDLTIRMRGDYRGDYAVIKTSLNAALDNLEDALAEVAVVAEHVATAADQISGGSQNLAEGASEQASSLEEVAASLQELASMAAQSAGSTRQARGLVEAAGASTETGSEAMGRLSSTVHRIKESSDATGRIVKTIDEIAFQTNLLALNAAVEAARAGEAGKGFAVVAEEVRNLAMRSAEAAKETSRLIEESVTSSKEGVVVQAEVVKQLDEIRTGVVRVREVMGEIAAASEQQTEGVGQINEAVEEMNAVTQRSAASSEESASAAEELSGQAQRMAELVARFVLSATSLSTPATHTPGEAGSRRNGAPRPAVRAGVAPGE
jgi:methyl-accepting chemotaxis protein